MQSSTYVLLLAIGYRSGGEAPIFADIPPGTPVVDPVVQALTLTDVVVEATVTALLLALAVQAHKRFGTLDPDELGRAARMSAARPARRRACRCSLAALLARARAVRRRGASRTSLASSARRWRRCVMRVAARPRRAAADARLLVRRLAPARTASRSASRSPSTRSAPGWPRSRPLLMVAGAGLLLAATSDVGDPLFHVLMLVFLAGMVGFCLTGDLFNLFVFFELMSVSAYALAGYKIEEPAPLEGALNFAVTNTIGAFLVAARDRAALRAHGRAEPRPDRARARARRADDGWSCVAFALIACGFLVKAAIVPFHFWLADAYAVAPTPVCLLLAGAMSELGLFGIARVWFGASRPRSRATDERCVRAILVGARVSLTALWGRCDGARAGPPQADAGVRDDLVRRLFLVGIGLLTEDGVAGTGVYVVADGFAKAVLFACVGIVQHRLGRVGQATLYGRGRARCGRRRSCSSPAGCSSPRCRRLVRSSASR